MLDAALPRGQRRADALAWLAELDDAPRAEGPWLTLRAAGLAGLPREGLLARFELLEVDPASAREELGSRLAAGAVLAAGDRLFDAAGLSAPLDRALEVLRAHQARQPFSPGLPKEELRQTLGFTGSPAAFSQLLAAWATSAPIFASGERVRADSARPELSPSQQSAMEALRARIEAAEPAYQATVEELKDPALHLLLDGGEVVKLADRLFAPAARMQSLIGKVAAHFHGEELLEVGHVKEWTGASRKFAVPMLEWLDAQRITSFGPGGRRRGPDCPA